jgi:hypothetical protein
MAQQINLYNPIFLQKKKHFSAVTMLQALGLLLGGILLFYAYVLNDSRTLGRVAAEAQRQVQTQGQQVAQLMREFSPEGQSKLLEEEVARATTRLKQREDLLAVLRTGGLGNTDGFARYMVALARQTMNGVWLTGFVIAGDETEIQLSGRVLHADLVPSYIRTLNREEVMRGRRIAELRLTAREERPAVATAAPGAVQAPAQPQQQGSPLGAPPASLRYVEFSLSAVRGAATPAGEEKGTK